MVTGRQMVINDVSPMGPFKCYVTQMGGLGFVRFSGEKRYECVRFDVISVTG